MKSSRGVSDKSIEETEWMPREILARLNYCNIRTLLQFSLTNGEQLERLGIEKQLILGLRDKACKEMDVQRGNKITPHGIGNRIISTGARSLDGILGGGIRTGVVTSAIGADSVGKTQLAFQLSINVQLHESDGGLDGEVVFIDSLGTFRPERLAEMASVRGINVDGIMSKIFILEARSPEVQMGIPTRVKDLLRKRPVKLLVIDTVTDNFLHDIEREEGLILRQSLMARHLHDLAILALKENIAVFITNTIRSRIELEGNKQIESGGPTVSNGPHIKIGLRRNEGGWKAKLLRPPSGEEVCFRITKEGISDC